MLSRRRQSRHLIYATLSPTPTISGRTIASHHFYSQANISLTFNHPTPSIICSSPSQPQCSSYETLKELYAKLTETRQPFNTFPPSKPKNFHNVCERKELSKGLQNMMSGSESGSKLGHTSNCPRLESALFDQGSESKRYPNGSGAVKKSESKYLECSESNVACSEVPLASVYQRSDPSSEEDTRESAEVAWSNLGQLYEGSGSLASALETFAELEVDQKPIREEAEPLLFAMSPLWSEPGWAEFPNDYADSDSDSDEESEDSDEGSLGSENEMLSNTLLAPIDIPGTKKSTLPIYPSGSEPLHVDTFPVKLVSSSSHVFCS